MASRIQIHDCRVSPPSVFHVRRNGYFDLAILLGELAIYTALGGSSVWDSCTDAG